MLLFRRPYMQFSFLTEITVRNQRCIVHRSYSSSAQMAQALWNGVVIATTPSFETVEGTVYVRFGRSSWRPYLKELIPNWCDFKLEKTSLSFDGDVQITPVCPDARLVCMVVIGRLKTLFLSVSLQFPPESLKKEYFKPTRSVTDFYAGSRQRYKICLPHCRSTFDINWQTNQRRFVDWPLLSWCGWSTKTTCGWKGVASYYTVDVNGKENKDAAWYYSDPKAQASNIKNHVAFWRGVEVKKT